MFEREQGKYKDRVIANNEKNTKMTREVTKMIDQCNKKLNIQIDKDI